jgi:hypothetical protein
MSLKKLMKKAVAKMDKRFLQSIGITVGLPRWKAYLLFLSASVVGAGFLYTLILILYFMLV